MPKINNTAKTRQENLEYGADEVVAWALLVHEDTMRVMRGEQKEHKYMLTEQIEAREILTTFGMSKPGRKGPDKPNEFPTFNVFLGPKEKKQLPVVEAEVLLTNGD